MPLAVCHRDRRGGDRGSPAPRRVGTFDPSNDVTTLPSSAAGSGRFLPGWAWFLLAYVLAWTVLPVLLAPSFPLDVVEGIAWGHEAQWGYYKHPPLPAWLLYPAFRLLGRCGPYLLGQLSVLLALYFVFRLASRMLDERRAWLAAALPYAVYYYTWPTLEFNHNIAQIPVWSALAWYCHGAVRGGRLRDWIWLGVWAGIGVLTKYSIGILLLCLLGWMLLTPQRTVWRTLGPWLAIAIASAVAGGHLIWLVRHDLLPLAYLAARSGQVDTLAALWAALSFLGAQALAHLPLLLALLFGGVRLWRWRPRFLPAGQRVWLATIALAPAMVTALVGLVAGAGLHDAWGTPMWSFSGLLIVAGLPVSAWRRDPRVVGLGVAAWMVLITLAMALYLAFGAQWRDRPTRMDWPSRALAGQARSAWQAVSTCPLRIVAGDYWDAGQVAEGSTPMASILIAGDVRYSPWITSERLRRQGALLVWREQQPDEPPPVVDLLAAPPFDGWRVAQGAWTIAWPRGGAQNPLRMRWRAYVPADCAR